MLSNTAEYALRIMIALAEADADADRDSLTSRQIAEITKVPVDYALKVLQQLSRAGLVKGHRGRRGGYRLVCDPDRTTLLDVVNVVDPIERITECPLGRSAHRTLCPLHRCLDDTMGALQDRLREMTIGGVVQGAAGPTLCQPRTRLPVAPGPKKTPRK